MFFILNQSESLGKEEEEEEEVPIQSVPVIDL